MSSRKEQRLIKRKPKNIQKETKLRNRLPEKRTENWTVIRLLNSILKHIRTLPSKL